MIEAYVLVRVSPVRLEEAPSFMKSIKQSITDVKGVKEVKGVFGRYDFIVEVKVETPEELGTLVTEAIRSIRGVAETETLAVGF